MAKGQTNIAGLHFAFRIGKKYDAFRVQVFAKNEKKPLFWLSRKVDPTGKSKALQTLKKINDYLKAKGLHKDEAQLDLHFQTLKTRLASELKEEHALKEYKAREWVELRRKSFNFESALEQFVRYKENTSAPYQHRAKIILHWIPFFDSMGCKHPREWVNWRLQAEEYLKTAKSQKTNEPYSIHSRPGIASALNEFLRFLKYKEYITANEVFSVLATVTTEQIKRGRIKFVSKPGIDPKNDPKLAGEKSRSSRSRRQDTYSLKEVVELKSKIDNTYKDNGSLWKNRAYCIYLGICTGLRRGNLMGLTPNDLFPEAEIPHFQTRDNVVSGYGRGYPGMIIFELSSKTFVDQIKLPLIQPSPEIAAEVARYIKKYLPADRYLFPSQRRPENPSVGPDYINKWWKKICGDIGMRYLSPHDWKHSYATIGAENLAKMYDSNPYRLQICCLHEKFDTTLKYVRQKGDQFLEGFKRR